ncbi:SusD/RagB family nutrient-binding outer membrane lipoprotein [Chitinophaga silvisoli]|uniref:SusD/RagB family nutrient-binding outer membrane lipoprotein n=1 Tax=Chitinophaga silvisoli TaxID=2291814 RepID=A0A3E1P0N9_9BACT|nr:SusD/RagB family nutrient-binding outer membrane lipoprotein [Chitinophaga silvisoli]RFM33761.1 SusD/RagB family nutrient-binding outer membrane lipoprotein [Chitinophaga silvisoli]
MKRLFLNIAFLALLTGTFSSCKKQLDENYLNPELTTTGSMSKLLSGMYLNKRIHPSYWDYYTFVMAYTGAFSQTVALSPGAQMYIPSTSYTENRWVDFYDGVTGTDYNYDGPGIMSNYREMQTTYNALTASQQEEQVVFLKIAEVIVYDQASQMIDLWGDIPFSESNSLNTTRSLSYAKFDDAASLYDTMITNLKSLNTYFDTATVATTQATALSTGDLMFGGDLSKWQRYANSLRLRLLMRISNYDESTAKSEVTTMLNDAGTYPMISSNDYNAVVWMNSTTLRSDLNDVFTGYPYAPAYLLDTMMVANGDPRTDVFWDAGKNGFKGFPSNGTSSQYDAGGYATYDSATFFYNYNIPAVLMTAAEVSFLKAEADERWSIGTAQTDYENGITQSTAFYYSINNKMVLKTGDYTTLTAPTATTISTFLLQSAIAYSGTTTEKLAKIYTQKWMNYFILQAGQAWAEYRRTGYPVLHFATSTSASGSTPPDRLLYPSSEQLYNSANYSKVSAKDTRDTKIFWDVN